MGFGKGRGINERRGKVKEVFLKSKRKKNEGAKKAESLSKCSNSNIRNRTRNAAPSGTYGAKGVGFVDDCQETATLLQFSKTGYIQKIPIHTEEGLRQNGNLLAPAHFQSLSKVGHGIMIVPQKICPAHRHSFYRACMDVLVKNYCISPFKNGGKNSQISLVTAREKYGITITEI